LRPDEPQIGGALLERYQIDDLEFGGPAVYRIVVQGKLSERKSSLFEEMGFLIDPHVERPELTTLRGLIRDQAALAGILDMLYGMHLSIVHVEIVAGKDHPRNEKNRRQD
jgi:hypothetical protein